MMRIVLFVVAAFLFAQSVTEFSDWRERGPIRANDVLEMAMASTGVKSFDRMLWAKHSATDYEMRADTVGEDFSEVRDVLGFAIVRFMMTGQTYAVQMLHAYCDLAYRMVKKREIDQYSMDAIREIIGFPDGHEHCMVTAFYDSDENMLDFGLLLESTFFFQTIGRDRGLTVDDLRYQLKRFRQRFDTYRRIFQIKWLETYGITAFDDLISKLNEFKRAITDFSNTFCTWWRPFVSHLFVTNPAGSGDVQTENLFVDHVFHCEICVITFQWNGHRISSWNCDGILKSQEYRYQEYLEDAMAPFDVEQNEIYENEIFGDPIPRSYFSLLIDEPEDYSRKVKYSLATLKHDLQWNSYYLNVVKYYNITSSVMLLVSIKEGKKILKWIKFVVQRNCSVHRNEKTVDDMRRLRSPLFAFKAVFDKIVSGIQDKKRINVTRNKEKKKFDKTVNALMALLDFRDNLQMTDQMERICDVIPNELLKGEDYDARLGENQIYVKFEGYYGTEPILNISQLYHYVVNDF